MSNWITRETRSTEIVMQCGHCGVKLNLNVQPALRPDTEALADKFEHFHNHCPAKPEPIKPSVSSRNSNAN